MTHNKSLTGGCFNTIHPGHIYLFRQAKKLSSKLVVVLTNDKNNKKPYAVPAKQRKKALELLNIVDEVLIGEPDDKIKIVKKIKPDIIIFGYDQIIPYGLKDFAFAKIKKLSNHSTKKIL